MLLDGISGACRISHLNLAGNSLAAKSVTALARILSTDVNLLHSLDLSCNAFTEEGMDEIAMALRNNKVIILGLSMHPLFFLDTHQHGSTNE